MQSKACRPFASDACHWPSVFSDWIFLLISVYILKIMWSPTSLFAKRPNVFENQQQHTCCNMRDFRVTMERKRTQSGKKQLLWYAGDFWISFFPRAVKTGELSSRFMWARRKRELFNVCFTWNLFAVEGFGINRKQVAYKNSGMRTTPIQMLLGEMRFFQSLGINLDQRRGYWLSSYYPEMKYPGWKRFTEAGIIPKGRTLYYEKLKSHKRLGSRRVWYKYSQALQQAHKIKYICVEWSS